MKKIIFIIFIISISFFTFCQEMVEKIEINHLLQGVWKVWYTSNDEGKNFTEKYGVSLAKVSSSKIHWFDNTDSEITKVYDCKIKDEYYEKVCIKDSNNYWIIMDGTVQGYYIILIVDIISNKEKQRLVITVE